jgi:Heparinase II/III-like protein
MRLLLFLHMRWCVTPLLSLIFFSVGLCADLTEDSLLHLRPGHPRLLLTDKGLATAVAAAKSDPVRAALHARIIATAEGVLGVPPARYISASSESLDQARYAVHSIVTCALAYRLTHDDRFLARAKSELFNVAAFPDWNPGHFLDVGELSFAVAIGYDWLYAQLQPEERATLKRALLEKSLAPADTAYHAGSRRDRLVEWAYVTSNWNQVCNSGVLSAALVLADEEPEVARKIITGARESIPHGMAVYAPDGEYPEGPGYWTYGTTYAVIALAELESALGTDFGLAAAPGFDRTADYHVAVKGPSGLTFNYADSTDDLQNSPASTWLAKRFHVATALRSTRALLADDLRREKISKFDPTIQQQVVNRFFALHAIWFPEETAEAGPASDLPLDLHFSGIADIALFRSAWNDPRAIFVGFKAGENAYHHNHLDLGSFVLDADGQRWALDLGPDVYELPGYNNSKQQRWSYFRTNNHSHNTVTPGDGLQRRQIVAPIVAFGSTPERGFAVADLTPAYPDEAASLRRGIALLDRARVLVQDEYRPTQSGLPLHWTMVTRAKVDLADDGRSATLTKEGRTLRVDLLEPATARLHLGSTKPPTAAENQNEGTAMLAIDVTPRADAGTTRVAVLLTPIGEKWPKLAPPLLDSLADWR